MAFRGTSEAGWGVALMIPMLCLFLGRCVHDSVPGACRGSGRGSWAWDGIIRAEKSAE